MQYISYLESPLGRLFLQSDGESLTYLCFSDMKSQAGTAQRTLDIAQLPVFIETREWLKQYFEGRQPDFRPRLGLAGTEFQRLIYDLLLLIPFGSTVSYGELARDAALSMGKTRMSAQAVGGALSRNPINIIIPCHRVLGRNGALTGYAGGMERKYRLLRLERVEPFCLGDADIYT